MRENKWFKFDRVQALPPSVRRGAVKKKKKRIREEKRGKREEREQGQAGRSASPSNRENHREEKRERAGKKRSLIRNVSCLCENSS